MTDRRTSGVLLKPTLTSQGNVSMPICVDVQVGTDCPTAADLGYLVTYLQAAWCL
jgi:hypothetical protein